MDKKCVISPVILFLFLAFTMTGCSGGGGGESSTPPTPATSPSLQVLPASYNFGTVTTTNSPAPLEVRIKNNGTAALIVSNITLSDPINFSLNSNGGSKPCASNSPTIPAADSCTFQVGFQPATDATFAGNVQIRSNDGSSPVFTLTMNGIAEPVATLTVRINQLVTSCPTDVVNAYVSVTDQGGYPIPDLVGAAFTVIEGGTNLGIPASKWVDQLYEKIAIATAMDYSGSISSEVASDMQNGTINLFNNLRAADMGEVVKFGTDFQVMQAFTSDKTALAAAAVAPYIKNNDTFLYDAAIKAVDDTALMVNFRKAVIVLSDGFDFGSTHTLNQVISDATAKGVPIFTVGLGSSVNTAVLTQMANDTGGQFFVAQTSQNLATIYQQLTSVLYEKQYILTFNQTHLGLVGGTANLNIKATTPLGKFGDDTMLITSCN
jgi:VWFA-related protein